MCDKIILNKFSERFFNLVKENNTDINTLAKKIGIKSKSTIYRYMNGEMTPKVTTVKYLAEYYCVNPAWLMGYDVSKERNLKLDDNTSSISTADLKAKITSTYGYTSIELLNYYIQLNDTGQNKALENVQDLTKIPEYTEKKK